MEQVRNIIADCGHEVEIWRGDDGHLYAVRPGVAHDRVVQVEDERQVEKCEPCTRG